MTNTPAPSSSQAVDKNGIRGGNCLQGHAPPSYSVKDARGWQSWQTELKRTHDRFGLSSQEVWRVKNSINFFKTQRHRIACVTFGDELFQLPPAEANRIISKGCSWIVRYQMRAGLPQHWLRVIETTSGLHAHIAFPATPAIVKSLRGSRTFRPYLKDGEKAVQLHTRRELDRLCGYLIQEGTVQAAYAHRLGRSEGKRSFPYPAAALGDRVKASPAMQQDAADYLRPFKATNSSWKPPALDKRKNRPERAASIAEPIILPKPQALKLVGQLALNLDEPKPSERLTARCGGVLPPVAAIELEFRRHRAGLTQRELAARSGISQPQIANALAGRRALSRQARQRLLEVLKMAA